jgi:hypothetical protein
MTHRDRSISPALKTLVLLLALVSMGQASEGGLQKTQGTVSFVKPEEITVQDGSGREIQIHTNQDYSGRVSPGDKVTAWHRLQGSVEKLDRIEIPLEFLPIPPADFLPAIKRVVLLPSSNAGDASEIYSEIETKLDSQFHWVVANRMLAEEMRRRDWKARGIDPATAPHTAAGMPAPLEAASTDLVEKVADAARADAVLEVRVEYSMLRVNSHTAEWDGQKENFGTSSARFAASITLRSVHGQVPVATAILRLFDSHGKLLWSQRRGIRVLAVQTSMGNEFRDRPLTEGAQDASFLSGWLDQVFASWIRPGSKPLTAILKD